jgi:TPP-dependent indolepyruvate ferredoxin oxidoreductase alpha subunit
VQRELREFEGVSVLIYDQVCAAEKRRRRKKGEFPAIALRVFINEPVREGCGDCAEQSNCTSLLPQPTEYGLKRRVDQSSCNADYSCRACTTRQHVRTTHRRVCAGCRLGLPQRAGPGTDRRIGRWSRGLP